MRKAARGSPASALPQVVRDRPRAWEALLGFSERIFRGRWTNRVVAEAEPGFSAPL